MNFNLNNNLGVLRLLVLVTFLFLATFVFHFTNGNKIFIDTLLTLIIFVLINLILSILNDLLFKEKELIKYGDSLKDVIQDSFHQGLLLNNNKENRVNIIDATTSINFPEKSSIDKSNNVDLMFVHFDKNFLNKASLKVIRNRMRDDDFEMRILLLDPYSEYIQLRGEMMDRGGYHLSHYYGLHIDFRKLIHDYNLSDDNIEKKIKIRFYNNFPTMIYLRCANYCWYSPLWPTMTAISNGLVEINSLFNSILSNTLRDNFEKYWNENQINEVNFNDLINPPNLTDEGYIKEYKIKHSNTLFDRKTGLRLKRNKL